MFYKKIFHDRQCSVFITTSLTISVTLFSIHSMALLGPRKVYFTGISRPYAPSVYCFTLDFTTNVTVWNAKNWSKNLLKFFGTCPAILSLWKICYGKFIVLVVYFVLYLSIVVTKFWIPNVHVSIITTNVRVQSMCLPSPK